MTPPRKHKSTVAVLVGAAIGNGISYAVLFVCGFFFLWYLVACGVPADQAYTKAHESTGYLGFAHTVAFVCLVPGGIWTAKLSHEEALMRNALIAGLAISALTLLAYFMPYELPAPNWSRVVAVFTPILAYLVGARIHARKSAA